MLNHPNDNHDNHENLVEKLSLMRENKNLKNHKQYEKLKDWGEKNNFKISANKTLINAKKLGIMISINPSRRMVFIGIGDNNISTHSYNNRNVSFIKLIEKSIKESKDKVSKKIIDDTKKLEKTLKKLEKLV